MTTSQLLILGILFATVAMFLWGRWRHDMVAVGSLLSCVLAGLVPAEDAFSGFGHPAVITVACVLVLSRGLQTSGAIDALTRVVLPAQAGITVSTLALVALGAGLSGFMNNVGAMALLMPVAMQLAARLNVAPGQILMPLAFSTILGGMTTLIGTPPNLIVSGFRAQTGAGSFAMFDFAPVGVTVALAGVLFIALLGRRLVPARQQTGIEGFESGAYITEARVPEDGKAVGMRLRKIEELLDDSGAQVLALIHADVRLTAPNPLRTVRAGDILVIEAEAEALANALSTLGLKLEEAVKPDDEPADGIDAANDGAANVPARRDAAEDAEPAPGQTSSPTPGKDKTISSGDIVLMELAVLPGSGLAGRSASDLLLRTRYGLNLLAISRQGQRLMKRLRAVALRNGDLLLMQGPSDAILEFAADNGCVPLATRELRMPNRRKAWAAGIIMAVAVGSTASGLLPPAIAFAGCVLASMGMRTVPPQAVYGAVDWPVIVLLGALIPVAGALESSGTADMMARFLLDNVAQGNAVLGLLLILLVSMFLSDVMNNAATAAVMCPIAIGTAQALGVNADSFLMAVAIGASCAFLTPIGHQNNTLILGPGGFHFSDYWKLGLPTEMLVIAIAMPLLLVVWPL
ncbi:MAG: anion permease [Pseudomonadales bacterium]|nr:anion permease [Pseudomonadales bacterium]MCP5185994.1 anion permease [Pseudomonadales bacterium]